jgi:hypothetical protein
MAGRFVDFTTPRKKMVEEDQHEVRCQPYFFGMF